MRKLITILFLAFTCIAHGQYTPNSTYGIQYNRIKPSIVLHLPVLSDTNSLHTTDTSAQIGIYHGKIYFHSGYWQDITSGFFSSVRDSLMTIINNNNDSLTTIINNHTDSLILTIINDSIATVASFNRNQDSIILTLSNGTRFAVKDSTGGGDSTGGISTLFFDQTLGGGLFNGTLDKTIGVDTSKVMGAIATQWDLSQLHLGTDTQPDSLASLTTFYVDSLSHAPEGSPSTGHSVLPWPTTTGGFVTHDNDPALWNGSSYGYTVPANGNTLTTLFRSSLNDKDEIYQYDSAHDVWNLIAYPAMNRLNYQLAQLRIGTRFGYPFVIATRNTDRLKINASGNMFWDMFNHIPANPFVTIDPLTHQVLLDSFAPFHGAILNSDSIAVNDSGWINLGAVSGGSGGISQLGSPAYGLTRTNDSTYIADTTVLASQTRLTNSLATKQDLLVSGTNIKTINGNSVLGSGDLSITSGSLDTTKKLRRQAYGILYKNNSWATLSDFTNNGGTFSATSNKITGTGGANNYTQSLDISTSTLSYTCLERWKLIDTVVIGSKSSTSYGNGLGVRSYSSGTKISLGAYFDASTGATSGKVLVFNSFYGTIGTSATAVSFSVGDTIIISVERKADSVYASAFNQSTKTAPASVIAYGQNGHNTGKFAIFSMGGDFTVTGLSVTSAETVNADLMFVGDSRWIANSSGYTQAKAPYLISKYYPSYIISSGSSDRTGDIKNRTDEIIALHPRQVLIEIGLNDIAAHITNTTWQSNDTAINGRLTRAGIRVIWCNGFYSNVSGISDENDFVNATFPLHINTWNATKNIPGVLQGDNVHLTDYGHQVVAGVVVDSKAITEGEVYDNSFPGNGLNNPMTTAGDIIYENATPAPARLGIGSTGNVLTVVSGLPAWQPSQAFDTSKAYTWTPPSTHTFILNSLGTSVTPVITLSNTTAGTQNSPSIDFIRNGSSAGIYQNSAGQLIFHIGGTTKMTLESTPKLTIGSTQIFSTAVQTTSYIGGSLTPSSGALVLQSNNFSSSGTAIGINAATGTVTTTSGTYTGLNIAPTINETSGSTANTILKIAPTLTAIGSGGLNYVDIGNSTTSYFKINNTGNVFSTSSVNIGTTTADASAALQITSTTQGLLLPRMTKAQRDAIASPVAGLAIYQTDNTPGLRVYNGTNWMKYTETAD